MHMSMYMTSMYVDMYICTGRCKCVHLHIAQKTAECLPPPCKSRSFLMSNPLIITPYNTPNTGILAMGAAGVANITVATNAVNQGSFHCQNRKAHSEESFQHLDQMTCQQHRCIMLELYNGQDVGVVTRK